MIYKNKYGELWYECGNRVDADGFYPVDVKGNRVAHITGDQNVVYECDKCQACIHLDKVVFHSLVGTTGHENVLSWRHTADIKVESALVL